MAGTRELDAVGGYQPAQESLESADYGTLSGGGHPNGITHGAPEAYRALGGGGGTPGGGGRRGGPTTARGLWKFCFGSRLWPMAPFAVLAFVANWLGWPAVALFGFSFLGLIPLVDRLEFVTGQLALHTNPTVGGLLNATFSNAEEVIVVIVALRKGLLRLIQLSLLGSIFGNLLLGLGVSFVAGGVLRPQLDFNRNAALTNCCALALAAMGLMFPGLLSATEGELNPGASVLWLSRATAILLLIAYACYLYFHLVTHKDMFEGTSEDDDDDDDDDDEVLLGFGVSLVLLGVVTAVLAALCDFLVSSVEATSTELGIPISGLCMIALPLVNNVAEHLAAVVFAVKGKLDITISIAVGAAVQLAMLIFPIAVIGAWIAGVPLDLNFHRFDSCSLFLSVLATVLTLHEGPANWFKGVMLIFLYLVIGISYFNKIEKYAPHAP